MSEYCNPITANLFRRICALVKGGLLQEIYAANLGEIDSVTFTTNEITAITMKTNPVTTNPYYWYRIVAKKQTAGVQNTVRVGTNTRYIEQQLDFTVEGFDTLNKLAFESMVNGQAVFIGKDSSGAWHMIGRVEGAEMADGGTIGTGIALDDLVGGKATFIAQEVEVTPTITAGTTIDVLNVDGVTVDVITL